MAAASAVMHSSSTIASPMTRVVSKASIATQMAYVSYCRSPLSQSQRRSASLRVRCSSEGGQKEELSTPSSAPISPPPQPTPPSSPKVSTKFGDILAFSGPAPERINGRLAMVGFVGAMAAELSSGQDVLTQISNGGVPWFLGTSVLLTLASLIPLFKGVSVQSKSDGIMTSDAELWNGRFAMLGLVALAFTEYVKHGALV